MARPSTVDRLPAEHRDLIARLRENGRTIDEIREALHERGAPISRTALGRHVQEVDAATPEALGIAILSLTRAVSRLSADISSLRRSLVAGRGTRPRS